MTETSISATNGSVQTQKKGTQIKGTMKTSVLPEKRPSQPITAPSVKELKRFLLDVSAKYGQDYDVMENVIQCESGFQTNTFSRGEISYGVAQFTPPTFSEYCSGSYVDPYAQLSCMGKMFHDGLAARWDCYRQLYP